MTLNPSKASKVARDNLRRWRSLPDGAIYFVRDQFGIEPDEWQKDALRNYITGNRSGAKACKGPGKTAFLAWCSWHFLACYPHSNVAATSITGDNLRDGLWKEMSKWQQKSPMLMVLFTWRPERITNNEYPETWFMSARKWSRDSDTDKQGLALAGLHADYIMFVIDEAGGVPDAVMAAAEAALANAGTEVNPNAVAKLLICGNPTHLSGPLYRACTTEASLWKMIEITGDPDDPKRSPRISATWAREQIAKYGRENPWVLVNVFGKFPPTSINALLGPDMVEEAMRRVLPVAAYKSDTKILGVDVGGGGADPSAICPRQGLVHFKPKLLRLDDPKLIAGAVAQAIIRWEPHVVNVDITGGWGSGVISWLTDWGYAVSGVGFAEKSYDRAYANKRTEMIYNFSMAVRNGACLPPEPALREACCAQTYTHYKDQMIMEPKDELKAGISDTTGFDMLDGYALTYAYPVGKPDNLAADRRNNASGEYDPIDRHEKQMRAQEKMDSDYNPLQNI